MSNHEGPVWDDHTMQWTTEQEERRYATKPMTLLEAAIIVAEQVDEWHFEDNGQEFNSCWACGWDTRKDQTPTKSLGHHPECELRAALDVIEKERRKMKP